MERKFVLPKIGELSTTVSVDSICRYEKVPTSIHPTEDDGVKYAASLVVKAINENENLEFIYSDEDKIDEYKERFEPYFKPDYSPDTLACNNYITHFVVVKKLLIDRVGKLNSEFNGAQDFDFVLRATREAKKIVHISSSFH
jgi:hypothetical protein